MEDKTLLCLQITKLEQFEFKGPFVGAFADAYFSFLGQGEVKYVVVKLTTYINFVLW